MIPCIGQRILAASLYTPYRVKDVAEYLKNNVRDQENLIIDYYLNENSREPLKLLTGINPVRFIIKPFFVNKNNLMIVDEKKFFKVLKQFNVTVLGYAPTGELGGLKLETKGTEFVLNEIYFKRVYSSDDYFVYRLQQLRNDKDENLPG